MGIHSHDHHVLLRQIWNPSTPFQIYYASCKPMLQIQNTQLNELHNEKFLFSIHYSLCTYRVNMEKQLRLHFTSGTSFYHQNKTIFICLHQELINCSNAETCEFFFTKQCYPEKKYITVYILLLKLDTEFSVP